MLGFFPRRYISRADERRVVDAIAAAERGHRGEIQVVIEARYGVVGPIARAAELFHEHGLDETQGGTGVLLYIAADDHRAAVWAGPGVHGTGAPGFWQEVTDRVAHGFRDGAPATGICHALVQIGALLTTAAPGEDTAGDELPNRLIQQ